MVLQKNVLFSGTIKENLRWGNENATDEQLIHVCQLAQADDLSRHSRINTILTLSRAEAMYPAVRNREFVLQEHF